MAEFIAGVELGPVRHALAWYPRDLWLWQLAGQWRRIAQEEHLPGRAAEVGDDLGSRVLVARLARDLMRLCLLVERRYALGLTEPLDPSPRPFHDRPVRAWRRCGAGPGGLAT